MGMTSLYILLCTCLYKEVKIALMSFDFGEVRG